MPREIRIQVSEKTRRLPGKECTCAENGEILKNVHITRNNTSENLISINSDQVILPIPTEISRHKTINGASKETNTNDGRRLLYERQWRHNASAHTLAARA
jgi:hypothetical protein